MSTAFSPQPQNEPQHVLTSPAAGSSTNLPASPVLDGDTLSSLTEGRHGAVPIVVAGRDPGILQRVEKGYLLKTERLTLHLDTTGACTGFTDPVGREVSHRFIGGQLMLERLQRGGIALAEGSIKPSQQPPAAPHQSAAPSPAQTTNLPQTPSPEPTPHTIGPIDPNRYPALARKGVPPGQINNFMGTIQSVFAKHGITPTPEQLAVITGNCLQENELKTGPSPHGVGICQWTDSRARNLAGFGSAYRALNPNASPLAVQAAFMLHEMGKDVGVRGFGFGAEEAAGDILFSAKTLNQAASWMKAYERYGTEGPRKLYAAELLNAMRDSRSAQAQPS